jgi:tRNA modification GTPase
MLPDLNDTIVALASAPGPGARAIVRLSGRDTLKVVESVLTTSEVLTLDRRRLCAGELHLPGVAAPLPATLYLWPPPRTYTGQAMAELHTLSSPPLVELLVARCLAAGARAAQPGEFTLRAFLAGKLDLTRAEAVLAVIESGSRDELKQALTQLAGGVTRPLQELREDLLNLLADVEAALDFSDEDIRFVAQDELLMRLARGLALVTGLRRQLDRRSASERAFRVALAGRPNAGKSSLFNALAGATAALVSPEPGTTRDYLLCRLECDGVTVELIDTAGWQPSTNGIEGQAQLLGREQIEQADLVLLCLEAGRPLIPAEEEMQRWTTPPVLGVATKCDLTDAPSELLATSAVTQAGVEELRTVLADRARAHARPALAPSLSRCRHHVESCLTHLRQAHAFVLHEEPPELLALELRLALEQLGEMVGAIYTGDLLDRIFSRFCIGK